MNATDERHGTSAGYIAGCRDWCCWQAKQRYDKRRRWEARQGFARKVPVIGTLRRLQSLRAMGWSMPRIAARAGIATSQMYDIGRHATLYAKTHRTIAEVYEAMANEQPPATTTGEKHAITKGLRTAARNGWVTPDRWFDIDDPNEQPDPGYTERVPNSPRTHDEIDPVVVDRILAGDMSLARGATKAERIEVVRRWAGSLNELERLTSWEPRRYVQKEAS